MSTIALIAAGWAALMLLTYGFILLDTLYYDHDVSARLDKLKEALTEE